MSAAEEEVELLPKKSVPFYHTINGKCHCEAGKEGRKCKSGACVKKLSENERELKTNMYYHISNPISRWKTDRKLPVKLILQILKTICVITQAALLINSSYGIKLSIFSAVDDRFSKLLIKDFSPSVNIYSAYTTEELLQELEYAGNRFYNLTSFITGAYDFVWNGSSIQPITVSLTQYVQAQFDSKKSIFVFNSTQNTVRFVLEKPGPGRSIVDQFFESAQDDRFQRFVEMDVMFYVNSVQVIRPSQIEAYVFTFSMHFAATPGGVIEYSLNLEPTEQPSMNGTVQGDLDGFMMSFELFILVACVVSFISALWTIWTAFKLAKAMGNFYHSKLDICLSWKERIPLFKIYYMYNIASDISTFTGTILKIILDIKTNDSPSSLTAVTIFFGLGILLQAAVLMGYLSYFRQFNTLTRTLNIAFFRLMKYIFCASILFLAFMMAGWLVLSPYHRKPDFFTIFLILFIYAVLNLFISLIIESYKGSKKQDSATRNEVRRFVFSGALTSNGVALRDIIPVDKYVDPNIVKRKSE